MLLGAYYLGETTTLARPQMLELPDSLRVDLGVFHDLGERVRLQFNVHNLTDERIYVPTN